MHIFPRQYAYADEYMQDLCQNKVLFSTFHIPK